MSCGDKLEIAKNERIKNTESFLKTLGTVEDFSEGIADKYRNIIWKDVNKVDTKRADT